MMRGQKVRAVARFELLGVVRKWSFLLSTFGLPLLLSGISGGMLAMQGQFLADQMARVEALRAKAEVLLTDGILLYAKHLLQGKVDPRTLDDSWNYSRRSLEPADVARSLADALGRREVAAVVKISV